LLCANCEEDNTRLLNLQRHASDATRPNIRQDTDLLENRFTVLSHISRHDGSTDDKNDLDTENRDGDATAPVSQPADNDSGVICFLQNKMNSIPFDDLVNLTADFYTSLEVETARKCLSAILGCRITKHNGSAKQKNRKIVAELLKQCLDPSLSIPKFKGN
jgi:hypothetical protein